MPHSRIEPIGEFAFQIYFANQIDPALPKLIDGVRSALVERFQGTLVQAIPSYTSLLLEFDPLFFEHNKVHATLAQLLLELEDNPPSHISANRVIEIPAYYGIETCLDHQVYRERGLSIEDIRDLHCSTLYQVYALGFSPGFAFMAQVPEPLNLPRQATPRPKVAKGSVAIAANQTAIYPNTSPGGWNIIAKTPIELYQPDTEHISLLQVGDSVRFVAIDKQEYLSLGGEL